MSTYDNPSSGLDGLGLRSEQTWQPKWLPMDSAPRDGTRILVAFKRSGVEAVSWAPSPATGFEIWCVDDHKVGPYALRGYVEADVLGWMPLPDPPDGEVRA